MIDDFLLVEAGHLREAEFRALLAGARYPARSPDVNVADIKAQVAANERGVQELGRVVERHGWDTVASYMRHVMDNAEESVRRVLATLPSGAFSYTMDDGSPLRVAVTVDPAGRTATVDFTGTGPQRGDNFNAPPAVTRAAVLYCFRCLVGADIPLNDGCLLPLRIVIPPGTFLSPEPGAAVVAGNTEVSQAVCNALLGRAGRGGLQPGDDEQLPVRRRHPAVLRDDLRRLRCRARLSRRVRGADAHDQHPHDGPGGAWSCATRLRLESFAIRRGSGGAGEWTGGDGSLRRIRFLEPMQAVIVASRRSEGPFGMAGGAPGAAGQQWGGAGGRGRGRC